ncbi:peptide ABC transporter permease [Rhodanobacter sp. B04]|uniref:ABC transporter permease n=1 Tax=Rhodanobacter sp. B04 TaxID=1945860 RepID=UPI000984477A|nr:ABC transporter permease [Rhodanobacter sp. B04]OOG66140.1 peptide ABC transporter permease [Rhodanobacter sp. B04]
MTVHPIIAALKWHKAGVLLIVLQIALTLAIVSNAIFIISQRISVIQRPTGVVERDLFRVSQSFVGAPSGDDPASLDKLDALQLADLGILRQLPDVQSVAASDGMPLQGSIWVGGLALTADQKTPTSAAGLYYGDEHMRSTLGARLVAGRDFNAGEILHHTINSTVPSPVIIVSQALADKLYPHGDALGKTVYLDSKPTVIIGIVDRLQVANASTRPWVYMSVMAPVRLDGVNANYVVRAKPGRLLPAMQAARKALFAANRMRVMPDSWGIQSLTEIRDKAYRADRGMALLMGLICLILLGVTAAGIVGLTSFWVGQRHRQIGIRRALGARRIDILHYFHAENLLIAGVGVVVGAMLARGLNVWLMTQYEMARLPVTYMVTGVLAMLAIGQVAVFVPARRASLVPPVVATRAA